MCYLGRVGRVRQLGGDVEVVSIHDVAFFIAHLHLPQLATLDKVLLEDVVEGGVEHLAHVLDHHWSTQREAVFQVVSEVLVVE